MCALINNLVQKKISTKKKKEKPVRQIIVPAPHIAGQVRDAK